MLVLHIIKVRKLRGLENACAVIIVESNLANEAMHHVAYIREKNLTNVCFLRENRDGSPGVLTTNASKRSMALFLGSLLESGRVSFHREFVTVASRKLSSERIKDMLIQQLQSYNRVIIPPNNVYGQAKEIYSGKGGGEKDDLAIALQICVEGETRFRNAPEKYRNHYSSSQLAKRNEPMTSIEVSDREQKRRRIDS
jgi:hypothetical protein